MRSHHAERWDCHSGRPHPGVAAVGVAGTGIIGEDPGRATLWRLHMTTGFGLLAAEALAAAVYVLMAPGAHPAALLWIAVACAAAGAFGVGSAKWVASRSWRSRLALTSTLLSIAALGVCASLDGGMESPFLYLAVLPVMYASMLLEPKAVATCGLATLGAYLTVGLTDSKIELRQQSLFMFSAVVIGVVILAVASSVYRERTERDRTRYIDYITELAATDQLTGCWNQRSFYQRLRDEVERASRYARPLSLIVGDVDLFKSFNDLYGHDRGDAALQTVAAILHGVARASDVIGRIGGDEFAILLPDTDLAEASALAERIVEAQRTPTSGQPTLSLGVASLGPAAPSVGSLFHAADQAMYNAKAAGRRQFTTAGASRLEVDDPWQVTADGRRVAEAVRQERRQRQETELILDLLLDASPVGFAFVDADFRIERINPAMVALSASPLAHQLGHTVADVVPDLWPQLGPHFGQVLQEGLPVRNLEVNRPNLPVGPPTSKLVNLYPVKHGETLLGIGVVVVDITERKRLEKSQEALTDAVVCALAAASEARDPYTAGHQRRVAELATAVATRLGYDDWTVKGIGLAASIHDVGKLAVPAEILSRPGRLTKAEFALVQTHAQAGCDMVSEIGFPWPVGEMIVQHHERLDGSGYPAALIGDEISLGARIIAVADVIEAVSSHRPYRSAAGLDAALGVIREGRGCLFDPQVVDAALSILGERTSASKATVS